MEVKGEETSVERGEGEIPEGSVCNVKNRNPRISASAMLATQFLFAVVLEITCKTNIYQHQIPLSLMSLIVFLFSKSLNVSYVVNTIASKLR